MQWAMIFKVFDICKAQFVFNRSDEVTQFDTWLTTEQRQTFLNDSLVFDINFYEPGNCSCRAGLKLEEEASARLNPF